jgi:hypothetical protein
LVPIHRHHSLDRADLDAARAKHRDSCRIVLVGRFGHQMHRLAWLAHGQLEAAVALVDVELIDADEGKAELFHSAPR